METFTRALARESIENSNGRGMLFRLSCFFSLIFLVAIFICAAGFDSRTFAATPPGGPAASAAGILGKDARLNGAPLLAGATLFPGDVIQLGEGSTAALRFGDSLVLAAPLTELVVETRGVSLRDGRLQVRADGGESFLVSGSFFHVSLGAPGGMPSWAEIRLAGMHAQVSTVAGFADFTAAGSTSPVRVRAGETATLDAAGAGASAGDGAAGPDAGQISRLVPQVQIDRASQVLTAAVSDRVFWNDNLRSGPTGRAHVTLMDGSQLNLGSDTSLRILQHDAQAQQTSLDLLIGRMRGKITKKSRPGAKFEIRTPVGVAGLVGTDLSLDVMNDYVELMVFEGEVRFTTSNGQALAVTAGNKLVISRAGVAEGPSPASNQEAQNAKDLTDIQGKGNQEPAVAAKRPIAPLAITVTGSAAAVGIGVWQGTRPAVSPAIP